jgi:hypothetical protein
MHGVKVALMATWFLVAGSVGAEGESAARADTAPPVRHAIGPKTPRSSGTIDFVFRDGSVDQEVTVTYLDAKTIEFTATVGGSCHRSESGRARKVPGDLASDDDEDDTGYLVDQFVYKKRKECPLYLRIEGTKQDKAKIMEECKETCPFNFKVVMRPAIKR